MTERKPPDDTPTDHLPFDDDATRPGIATDDLTNPGTAVADFIEDTTGERSIDFERGPDTDPGIAPLPTEEAAPAGGEVLEFARPPEAAPDDDEEPEVGAVPFEQLEALVEALLFAAERPLSVGDLKRLSGERDSRLISQALEALSARRADGGVQIVQVAGAYSLRTNPAFASWVSRLVQGKPVRLSRAMLETLAIVAYRQPITRPEIDDVRGVDCGPVLKTLLDRNLVRMIGKKEEVGRPILYGTTPEFLRIFSLKDLTQLPTLRQFHELSAEHQAKVDEAHPPVVDPAAAITGTAMPVEPLANAAVSPDPGEDDQLIAELEEASEAASRAAGALSPEPNPGS